MSGQTRFRREEHTKTGVVRGSMLADFERMASGIGLDAAGLIERVGIVRDTSEEGDAAVPISAIVELLEQAALISGITDFGLRLAEFRGLPDMGPINLLLREEDTLRDALKRLMEFIHIHADTAFFGLEEGDCAVLTLNIGGCPKSNRQAMDQSMAQVTSVIRWLLGEQWSPLAICFTHSQPLSTARYRQFFRCPVDFLHEINAIVLDKADLDRKIVGASPVLRRQIERYLRTVTPVSHEGFDRRVARTILQSLSRGEGRAEDVASRLGTTSRTLNRRLASFGLNYSIILEDTRKELAAQYLIDPDRPVSDVAGLIGFGSLSAFSTWFKKSFGCPPRNWRLQQSKKSFELH